MIQNIQSPFLWGSKGQKLTPEQVERERRRADAMLDGVGDTSPVGHWLQGAGRVVNAITGKVKERRADSSEALGMESADDYIANNPILSALIGGGGSGVGVGVPSGASQPLDAMNAAPVEVSPDQALANDVMTALGKHSHGSHAGQSHSDWLRYSNQSATRNKPLDEKLVSALSFLPEMGITMDVVSGGQDGKGQGSRRTGSTRHDHGGAADVDFYKDGRKLDWNNPDDIPIFMEIVKRSVANGVTGIGAGDDYMGAGRMHIGFGSPSVWGAGGSGANAPDWLRSAYNGAGQSQQAPQGATQASYTPQGGGMPQQDRSGVIAALSGAMSDPWVAKKYGPVIQSLMGQQMKRGDMDYQQQLQQSDPMYRAKLAQLTAPQQKKPIEVGGVLLDPDTFKPIFDSRQPSGSDGFTLSPGQQRFDAQGNPIASGQALEPEYETRQITMDDGSEVMVERPKGSNEPWKPSQLPEGGTTGSGGRAKLTESQAKTTLFSRLQQETSPVLNQIESIWDPANMGDAVARSTPIAGNFFQSEEGQIYQSAASAWAEGALRISTGAAATQPEIERNMKTYFAQPGDTPTVVEFKRNMRAMYDRAIQASLGNQMDAPSLVLPDQFAAMYTQLQGGAPVDSSGFGAALHGQPDADGWVDQGGVKIREKR